MVEAYLCAVDFTALHFTNDPQTIQTQSYGGESQKDSKITTCTINIGLQVSMWVSICHLQSFY